MESRRLRYDPLDPTDVDAFHAVVTDAHVRRFLFDGETLPRAWCLDAIATSQAAFAAGGFGLWLVRPRAGDDRPIGFCGFWVFDELGPAPQLLYAVLADVTGRGYATEIGRALVDVARAADWTEIVSAVDAPNAASIRVLEKLGFERTGEVPGAFGSIVGFRLALEQNSE